MNKSTDTPRTDACPHCGAEYFDAVQWECGTTPILDGDTHRSPLCKEREARQKAKAEVERLKAIADEQQATLKKWDESLKEGVKVLRSAYTQLIAAQESEAVWKTERDKADQRRLEAEAEVEKLKEQYEFAAESVARMHEAAVGEIRGPIISVIEDIKAVRERAEKAEAEVEELATKYFDMEAACADHMTEVDRLRALLKTNNFTSQ